MRINSSRYCLSIVNGNLNREYAREVGAKYRYSNSINKVSVIERANAYGTPSKPYAGQLNLPKINAYMRTISTGTHSTLVRSAVFDAPIPIRYCSTMTHILYGSTVHVKAWKYGVASAMIS